MRSNDADACLDFLARRGYHFLLEPRDIIAHRVDNIGMAHLADKRLSA
jgi:hypothetical protein